MKEMLCKTHYHIKYKEKRTGKNQKLDEQEHLINSLLHSAPPIEPDFLSAYNTISSMERFNCDPEKNPG